MIDAVILGRRLRDLARELGVDMSQLLLVLDLDGDAHHVQALFVLPDLAPNRWEDKDIDTQAAAFRADIEAHEEIMREDGVDEN